MIITTITDPYHFWNWVRSSDNYKNNFSLEGAKAVQAYFDELSDQLDGGDEHSVIEFDPIAWCCEFSEYDSLTDAWDSLGNGTNIIEGEELAIDDNIRLWLENNTTVIELDNGHVIVGEF